MARMVGKAALLVSVAASSKPDYNGLWKDFKKKFSQEFSKHEEQMRFAIFKANVDHIEAVNSKGLSYKLGINQFAHLTAAEFAQHHTGFKKPQKMWEDLPYLGRHTYNGEALDASVDWTKKGAVTPVKNQGQCGSCWSFSTTGALEGAWEIATGKLVSVSEQQFVDCDHVDHGCGGGLMDNAFAFAEKNSLCTEESYSYHARGGTCQASSCKVGIPKGGVTGFKDVSKDDEKALMSAVAQNPVSIAIEADQSVFQLYKSGVLTANCGTKLDHGVLAVGYGTENGQDYWLVKNSWGTTWGDNGYVKLERGKSGAGECGLLSEPSYPVVNGKAPPAPPPAPPAPPAPPSPPSPPTPGGKTHYEKPPCRSDEVHLNIQGSPDPNINSLCASDCTTAECPTDVPAGSTGRPECVLQGGGKKYCAQTCFAPEGQHCPAGATCERGMFWVTGICMWPNATKGHGRLAKVIKPNVTESEEFVQGGIVV